MLLKFSSINSEHLVASYSPSMFNNWVLSLIILNNQYISEVHSPIRKFGFCCSCLKLFGAEIEWGNAQSRCILQPLLSYISSSNSDYYVRTWGKKTNRTQLKRRNKTANLLLEINWCFFSFTLFTWDSF